MTVKPRELPIPPAAIHDPRSGELLRAWIADQSLQCTLNVQVWDDPGHWGIMLADVARHVANATHDQDGSDRMETIQRIRELFDAELDAPTDEPTGDFVEP